MFKRPRHETQERAIHPPLLDTTSISGGGFDLYSGFGAPAPTPAVSGDEEIDRDKSAASDEATRSPAQDFRLAGDRKLAAGWKARAADNLAAIRLAQTIEDENRNATPEEQDVLARFTAFGATELANNLFRRAGENFPVGWDELGNQLEQLVSREDLASLARATQYAHFTPEFVVRAIWKGLLRMGIAGGRDPRARLRNRLFFVLMPQALAGKVALTGIEMDATTARIARLLYPNALIRHEDFTRPACLTLTISSSAIRRSATAPFAATIRPASSASRCMIISSRARSNG